MYQQSNMHSTLYLHMQSHTKVIRNTSMGETDTFHKTRMRNWSPRRKDLCEYICVNVRENINEKDTFFQVCESVEQLQNSWTEVIQPLTTQKGGIVHCLCRNHLVFSNADQQRCLATHFNAIKNHLEMLWAKDQKKGTDTHVEDWRCLKKTGSTQTD